MNTRQATRPATRSGCAETSRRAPPEFSYHSLSLNGVDQYVDCGTGIGDALGDNYAGSLTVSLWFKADDPSRTFDGIFDLGPFDDGNTGKLWIQLHSEVLKFWLAGAAWNRNVAFTDTTSWHHLTCVYATGSESDSKMYLDGTETGSTTGTFPSAADMDFAGLKTIIGAYYSSSYPFGGSIDEVAIWNSALDADAVTAVYNSGAPNNLNQDNGDYTNSGDLQGWWRMGEGNDPGYYIISDASGNGNDGTTQNEPAWSNDTPQRWPQNFSYYGIDFNGVDQYVSTTADDTLATKSYSFWAKSDQTAEKNGIFDHGSGSIGAFRFNSSGTGPRLYMNSAYYRFWVDNSAQDDNAWHHHVVYIEHDDITNSKWYVDGAVQTASTTNSGGSADAYTSGIRIADAGGEVFNGSIDEFAVFDGELTSAQVTALYNGGKPAAIAGAEHWYRMGEGNTVDGALVTDLAATDSNALYLPGVASNYASVPDAADLDGFTDFTFEMKGVTFADWTSPATDQGLMSKYKTSTNSRSWRFNLQTDGKLYLVLSFNGTATTSYPSSEVTGVTDGATADIMAMRNGEDVRFYVDGVQLGTDVTCVTTALHNSTDAVAIGADYNTTGNPMTGSIQRARIWNSAVANQATPTETPVLDMNFTLADKGTSSFTATSGQTVTVNTTSIADPAVIRQATDGVNVNSPAWTKNTPS